MEISKVYLQTMLREFWSLNNEFCEDVTIVFLRKLDITDSEIERILHLKIEGRDLNSAEEYLESTVRDTKNYYMNED